MNKVTERFLGTNGSFGDRVPQILAEVSARIGFAAEREIWRGRVVSADKVGTAVFAGIHEGRRAVLKLQGLPPVIEEAELIRRFTQLNGSACIRAPHVYRHEPWQAERGWGWTLMEEVPYRIRIYDPPDPPERARRRFTDFYLELHGKAIRTPFLPREGSAADTRLFLTERLEHWLEINASVPESLRLPAGGQRALVAEFRGFCEALGGDLPMVFTHGHLGPHDIIRDGDGYVLFSNFFWGWRPRWYDLAFNVWVNLMAAGKQEAPSDAALAEIVSVWSASYASMPIVRQDHRFGMHLRFLMLERCVGSLLVDVPAGARDAQGERVRAAHRDALYGLARKLIKELGG